GAAFGGRQGLRFADFRDGTSITLLVVEAARAVPWTKPEDLEYAPGRPPPAVGGIFKGGFHAAMADGSARFFPATIDAGTLRALVTRNGGEQVDFTTLRVLRRAGERQPPPPPPPPRPRPPGR